MIKVYIVIELGKVVKEEKAIKGNKMKVTRCC